MRPLSLVCTARIIGALVCAELLAAAAPAPSNAPATDSGPAAELATARELLRKRRYVAADSAANVVAAGLTAAGRGGSLAMGQCLDVRAEALWRSGSGVKGLAVARRAVFIKEGLRPADPAELAASLHNLAAVYNSMDQTRKAIPLWERALSIRERVLGPDDIEVARTCNNLGVAYASIGRFDDGRRAHLRSLAIKEKRLGPDALEVSNSLNNLATLATEIGEPEQALEYHRRALAIRRKIPGISPIVVAATLNAMGSAYRESGALAQALDVLEESLALADSTRDPGAVEAQAFASTNLGVVQQMMGNTEESGRWFRRSLEIRERFNRPAQISQSLNDLAGYEARVGNLTAADSLARRALSIRRELYGDHDFTATTLGALAEIQFRRGHTREALQSAREALRINAHALGYANSRTASDRIRLGELLVSAGRPGPGLEFLKTGTVQLETRLGPTHPLAVNALLTYSEALKRSGHPREALATALRAERGGRESLRLAAQALSESEARQYALGRRSGLGPALALLSWPGLVGSDAVSRVWDQVIQSRALVLDETIWRNRVAARMATPEVQAARDELKAVTSRLSTLLIRRGNPGDAEVATRRLEAVRRDRDRAERQLARISAADRSFAVRRILDYADVVAALRSDEILVAYVTFTSGKNWRDGAGGFMLEAVSSKVVSSGSAPVSSGSVPSRKYGAFVVSGRTRRAAFHPLGDVAEVDTLVARWRGDVTTALFSEAPKGPFESTGARRSGDALRRALWDPLAVALRPTDRCYIVPDGALHGVSWAGLPSSGPGSLGATAAEFVYLSAERDLVPDPDPAPAGRGALLVGGADYDARGDFAPEDRTPAVTAKATHLFRTVDFDCSDLNGVHFQPLPGTLQEVERLAARLRAAHPTEPVEILRGAAATEAAFKRQAQGKAMLHIASHGFFLDGDCPEVREGSRAITKIAPLPGTRASSPGTGAPSVPLAGLAFAGANRRTDAAAGGDDGILTAEEIAALDLSGVATVTLSACDTGLGAPGAWEGLVGLRRALQIAGVRDVRYSLWPLSDDSGDDGNSGTGDLASAPLGLLARTMRR